MYFLGVEGSLTKTTAVVSDEYGKELIRVTGKDINCYPLSVEAARNNLKDIMNEITEKSGVSSFKSVCIGLYSLTKRADKKETQALTQDIIIANNIILDSYMFIALFAAKKTGNAAVAICGTDSIAAGRFENGDIITKGGMGFILGNEGSAFAIASAGIKAALMAYSGAAEKTTLTEKLFSFFSAETTEALINKIYFPIISPAKLALFAPEITLCAFRDDETALFVIKDQARLFSKTVLSLMRELPPQTPLFVYGGVFQHDEIFRHFFEDYLSEYNITFLPLSNSPSNGALEAAIEYYNNGKK